MFREEDKDSVLKEIDNSQLLRDLLAQHKQQKHEELVEFRARLKMPYKRGQEAGPVQRVKAFIQAQEETRFARK